MKLSLGAEMLSKHIQEKYTADKTFSHITLIANRLNTLYNGCKVEEKGNSPSALEKHEDHLEELQDISQMLSIVEVRQ